MLHVKPSAQTHTAAPHCGSHCHPAPRSFNTACSVCRSTRHVALGTPLRLLPGQVAALYVHSAMNDDTGLQYTTCGKENTVARDDHLAIRAGISHTGNAPFSVHNRRTSSRAPWGGAGGWFRAGLQNLRVEIGS